MSAPASTSPPPAADGAVVEKRASELQAADLDLSSQSLEWWLAQDKKEAGELLLQKAMVLMGVSNELGADSERGKALKKEAEELLSFANDVQSMPETQQAMAEAHKLLSELNAKYSHVAVQGQGLADESLKLWSSVSSSKEAQDLVQQGKSLLADWSQYAQSNEGKELLSKGQRMAQGQGGGLIAMIDEHVLGKDGKPVVEKDKLKSMAGQVSDVGKELHRELADDEDVQELMRRAQKDLKSVASQAQDAAHQSILEDKDNPLALQTLTEEQKTTLAIMKGEKYLRDFKDSGMGQKLLQQGTAYLASGSLSPSALMGQGNQLMNDEKSRQQLINKVKDSALEFLMAYLPTAKVPPVEGEKEGWEYKLQNIDLSGFKVQSKDVEVAINEEDGLSIWAINISCVMNGLEFFYQKNTFPKASGNGKAEAVASGVKFHMRLDLELPERYKKLISPSGSKSPSKVSPSSSPTPASAAAHNTDLLAAYGIQPAGNAAATKAGSVSSPSAASSGSPSPTSNSGSPPQVSTPKKTIIGSNLSKQIASNTAAPPARPSNGAAASHPQQKPGQQPQHHQQQHGKPPLSVSTAQQQQRPPPAKVAGQQPQQFNFPRSSSGVNPLSPSSGASPRSAYTPNGTPIPRENIIRNQAAVARAIAADTPRMVLSRTKVTMSEFQLKISTGTFKGLYNFLLKLLSTRVKEYLEVQLNEAINEQSSKLLASVNELSYEYLPLLEKIMLKADKIVTKKTGSSVIAAITGEKKEGEEETATTDVPAAANADGSSSTSSSSKATIEEVTGKTGTDTTAAAVASP